MKALVTGCAGFVGSTLSEKLLRQGWDVVGIDGLTPYYDIAEKYRNLRTLSTTSDRFSFIHGRLEELDLTGPLDSVDVVYHQAAQPGVRASWDQFNEYVRCNISSTYALLEACRRLEDLPRFVYASSSSVYGDAHRYPTTEQSPTNPRSPYGVTKLAAEQLVTTYGTVWGLPAVSLRYFTVYGPRQRPDMATRRLLQNAMQGSRFPLYGNGEQIRDFTYIDDIVEANILVANHAIPAGEIFNVSGGSDVSMNELIDLVSRVAGAKLAVDVRPAARGDVARTGGDSSKIRESVGWAPVVGLEEGIKAAYEWVMLNE